MDTESSHLLLSKSSSFASQFPTAFETAHFQPLTLSLGLSAFLLEDGRYLSIVACAIRFTPPFPHSFPGGVRQRRQTLLGHRRLASELLSPAACSAFCFHPLRCGLASAAEFVKGVCDRRLLPTRPCVCFATWMRCSFLLFHDFCYYTLTSLISRRDVLLNYNKLPLRLTYYPPCVAVYFSKELFFFFAVQRVSRWKMIMCLTSWIF